MAEFVSSIKLAGDQDTYTISPQIKQYTLLDLGFEQSNRGVYTYLGSLDRQNPFKPVARLKIRINPEMTGFKMETVNTNGMRMVNIFKHPRTDELITQYHFILNEMVDRHVFDRQ